jgi:hypothetical protein
VFTTTTTTTTDGTGIGARYAERWSNWFRNTAIISCGSTAIPTSQPCSDTTRDHLRPVELLLKW